MKDTDSLQQELMQAPDLDRFLSENREPINEFLDCQQPRLANCLFLRCHRLNSLNLASLH